MSYMKVDKHSKRLYQIQQSQKLRQQYLDKMTKLGITVADSTQKKYYAPYQLVQNPFNIKIVNGTRQQFGGQILINPVTNLASKGQIAYSQGRMYNQLSQNVDLFMQDNAHAGLKYRTFQNILKQKITQGKNAVKQYTLLQIAQFLPWVFSQAFLFQPLRSLLYCLYNNIKMTDMVSPIIGNIPQQMINKGAMQAIYYSLKGGPFLFQALRLINGQYNTGVKAFLLQTIGLVIELFKSPFVKKLDKSSSTIQNGVWGSIAESALDLYNHFLKNNKFFKIGNQEKMSSTQKQQFAKSFNAFRGTLNSFIAQIFGIGNLYVYGQIIINFNYLVKYGMSMYFNGVRYYYFPNQPTHMFTLIQGIMTVVMKNDQAIQIVPENNFTIQYLKSIIKLMLIQQSADVFVTLKKITTQKKSKLVPMQQFQNMYLNNLPVLQTQQVVYMANKNNNEQHVKGVQQIKTSLKPLTITSLSDEKKTQKQFQANLLKSAYRI